MSARDAVRECAGETCCEQRRGEEETTSQAQFVAHVEEGEYERDARAVHSFGGGEEESTYRHASKVLGRGLKGRGEALGPRRDPRWSQKRKPKYAVVQSSTSRPPFEEDVGDVEDREELLVFRTGQMEGFTYASRMYIADV